MVEQESSIGENHQAKACWGAPCWLRWCIGSVLGTVVLLVVVVSITSLITSRQYVADIPPFEFEQSAFQKNDQYTNHSVVIVGAGAAGLFAGYALKFAGIDNVQILEARSEFGGRTVAIDDFIDDVPLDLGAEWIHVQPDVLERLLLPFDSNGTDAAALPTTIRYRPQTIGVRIGDRVAYRNFFSWFYAETKFYDSTWADYLADQVVQPFLEGNIQLNTAVELIEYTDDSMIRLQATSGAELFADTVIVAVPLNILQDEIISFDPPVPSSKVNAWDDISVANGLKVWLEFSHRFYPDLLIPGGRIFAYLSEDRLFFDALFGKDELTDRHVLALFEVGPTADSKVAMADDELVELLLHELDAMFEGQASQYFLKSHVQNWSREQFIEGAYSYDPVESADQRSALRAPIDDRIYFCGEYLADDSSTVHGAAISGREVVRSFLKDLESRQG